MSRSVLGPSRSPIPLMPGALSPGVEQLGCEVNNCNLCLRDLTRESFNVLLYLLYCTFRLHRRIWEDNIKIGLPGVGRGGMDWIDLAEDRDIWRAPVNAVMNLRFT